MGKQYEGIKGFDPVRYRRFVAGEHVDSKGRNTQKVRSFIGIHCNIHICATIQKSAHVAYIVNVKN